ncbi:hypothetical protein PFISCL1PPCAC_10357 [Pristionchus fissidentatus]|uniref:Transmembrane protein n=1 Tax=Pristionchus fissidentatus TaxID=1538716 RepID=A0AAV5VKA8_9BILA|nr:hypothetical protein PFISCL1PPCAC_10357 [Pristionchus fissidentatus]
MTRVEGGKKREERREKGRRFTFDDIWMAIHCSLICFFSVVVFYPHQTMTWMNFSSSSYLSSLSSSFVPHFLFPSLPSFLCVSSPSSLLSLLFPSPSPSLSHLLLVCSLLSLHSSSPPRVIQVQFP